MELTALYNCSKVSGTGDLKYSSRANNKSGFHYGQLLHDLPGRDDKFRTL